MKISIVYDNTTFKEALLADWGFSALIERENTPTILFDTGTDETTLLRNMKTMGIDPRSIDEIFISHSHHDHIGGLAALLRKNSALKVWIPPSARRNIANAKKVQVITQSRQMHEQVYSTGELNNIEQSLIIDTEKGLVVVVGCSHSKVRNILKVASRYGDVRALIGGLHGFCQYELLDDLELVCPTHCTQNKTEIKTQFPGKYKKGGVGRIFEL